MLEIFKKTVLAMLVICMVMLTVTTSKKAHAAADELVEQPTQEMAKAPVREYRPMEPATVEPQHTPSAMAMTTMEAMEQIIVEETEQAYLYNEEDMELMARTVHAEARGEEFEGKVAVAQVIINRYESGRFGDSIRRVVFARNQFAVSKKYDDECMQAVEAAVEEKLHPEDMYYFRVSKKKKWRNFVFYDRIGDHSFYCAKTQADE